MPRAAGNDCLHNVGLQLASHGLRKICNVILVYSFGEFTLRSAQKGPSECKAGMRGDMWQHLLHHMTWQHLLSKSIAFEDQWWWWYRPQLLLSLDPGSHATPPDLACSAEVTLSTCTCVAYSTLIPETFSVVHDTEIRLVDETHSMQ